MFIDWKTQHCKDFTVLQNDLQGLFSPQTLQLKLYIYNHVYVDLPIYLKKEI